MNEPRVLVAKALAGASSKLELALIPNAALDARLLLQAATGLSFTQIVTKAHDPVCDEQLILLDEMLDQRIAGRSVNRILGYAEFYGRKFQLNEYTLEPRPDTETLVDVCIDLLSDLKQPSFADIGTGSGAIAISLSLELSEVKGLAIDLSREALKQATINAQNLCANDLEFVAGSYLDPLEEFPAFDLLVSNPPYIAHHVIETLMPEVRDHDPLLALDGGLDGLDAYRSIIAGAHAHIKPGGYLALEIGFEQRREVEELIQSTHLFEKPICFKDIAGHDRVVLAQKL